MKTKKNQWWACRAAVVVAAAMASLCASANVVINETNFPDANFRAYVSTLNGGDDGVFTDEELAGITSLSCSSKSIASLKGIEHFKLLQTLICYSNQLTSLDLSQNTALTTLNCYNNPLTSLDVSQNTALTTLLCNANQLTSLDVSQNTALETLRCYSNQLTSLDLSNNKALVYLNANDCARTVLLRSEMENGKRVYFMPIDSDASNPLYADGFRLENVSNWTNAVVRTVDGKQVLAIDGYTASYTYNTGLAGKDVTFTLKPTSQLVHINEENFPDANFRAYVSTLQGGDDGVFTDEELAGITSLSCSSKSIASLKGIEHFKLLQTLICYSNQLTSLDLSQNTALTTLNCYNNPLTSLDVSQNTALTTLNCHSNQLTSLDVSNNKALTYLSCPFNPLTSLDVSQNTALTELLCSSNQLTSLDLSNNKALVYLNAKNCERTLPMYYYMENGNKVAVIPVGNYASNPLYVAGFRLEKASNWTNATVSSINGKQMLVVNDATQPVTYSYDTGNQKFPVSFTIRWCVDVNGDGNLDTADMSALINVVLGNIEGDSRYCDVNFDGAVDALDVSALIGMICGATK